MLMSYLAQHTFKSAKIRANQTESRAFRACQMLQTQKDFLSLLKY